MATIQSHGLHEPAGISFLVAENLLPADPSKGEYVWKTGIDYTCHPPIDDEIVWTRSCVVWSRGGIVKRVFRLDLEKEEIRHALFTSFASATSRNSSHGSKVHAKHADDGALAVTVDLRGEHTRTASEELSRALVVILKSQAHIFFLSGHSHVVPLPFEVHSVFGTPRGLLFQMKVPEDDRSRQHPAPNSFTSPDLHASPSPTSRRGRRSSVALSQAEWSVRPSRQVGLPTVFSLTDPHSEMGLVLVSQSSRHLRDGRRHSGFDALGVADEIMYVSERNELSEFSHDNAQLMLVVTVNTNTNIYTVWTARYKDDEDEGGPRRKRRKYRDTTGGPRPKRQSSHLGMGTGTATPAGRPSAGRESFGPKGEGWNGSSLASSQVEARLDEEEGDDDFASKLAQDFGDIGVPRKASGRLSSLLARADLAGGQDRISFPDLATGGHHGSVRQSFGVGSARGSFGFNPRGSTTPAGGSLRSSNNFAMGPGERLLDELGSDLFEEFRNMDLRESMSGLPEGLLLSKVDSFALRFSREFQTTPAKQKDAGRVRISTLAPPGGGFAGANSSSSFLAVSVADPDSRSMAFVNLRADRVSPPGGKSHRKSTKSPPLVVHLTGVQHYENVVNSCKVMDGEISRIAALNAPKNGVYAITLLSPWSDAVDVTIPSKLLLQEPYGVPANLPHDRGVNRVVATGDPSFAFVGVEHPSLHGYFDIVDDQQKFHRLQMQLEPSNELLRKVLKVCRFVLRDTERTADSISVVWWDVMQWLHSKVMDDGLDLEWTATVVMLFTMAVPYLNSRIQGIPVRARKRHGFLRSNSGSWVDPGNWEALFEWETGSTGVIPSWMTNSAWSWIVDRDAAEGPEDGLPGELDQAWSTFRKNTFLIRCAGLAREFIQSPRWITASVCLPTSHFRNEETRRSALGRILIGLHLLREERKLSTSEVEESCDPLGLLAPVLAQIGGWLGWESWTWAENQFYGNEVANMDRWAFDDGRISGLPVSSEPFSPPSIFKFLEDAWEQSSSSLRPSFVTLLDLLATTSGLQNGSILWQESFRITPRTLTLNGFFSEVQNAVTCLDKVRLLYRWGLTDDIIETFPEGVSAPLYETIMQSQILASTSWDSALLELINRDDLCMSMSTKAYQTPAPPPHPFLSHDATRDFHQICNSTLDIDAVGFFEASAEADRFAVTRLIFREDKRFVEACRLLNQSKAPVAECTPEPEWTDSDLLEAQRDIVQLATLRTLSVPAGRGMLSYSGRLPLLTEKLPMPSFSLQCIMKPSNVTLSADRAAFSEDKVCWAFFHNGVSTGLAVSKGAKGIDTSWILYNKPHELTNRHAGFLLALGLNGHLKLLAKWVAFKYLTPKHTMTSIGLLLGLSVSYLGTMDTLITRLLSVHVTRMLPVGAAELNLSPLTQTAGIMGLGLLYYGSQHRRMSEMMLSEVESLEQEDSTSRLHEDMRDEGYRLAAGFALGFINVARGKDLKGMRDMQIVERLLAMAAGTKNVDVAHILDRATAGSTVALAIIFMKTNDETLAKKIDIPDTTVRYDYVRPDLFLLRTLARHIIMWDSIESSEEWFVQSLPKVYRRRHRMSGVRHLNSDDMPFFNIIAGLCFTLGLRFAGSAEQRVRNILVWYLDQFIRICRLPVLNYDERVARNSARNCQDIVALSAAAVMAGSGDLVLFRRLRSLHGRIDSETPYGSHMATHMGIGLLFLGGGSYTLGTTDLAVASLMCSMYPIFPADVLDNTCHLQAFRHLWVLAAEPRCLVPRDMDTRRPVSIPVSLTMKDGSSQQATAPCLLPYLNELEKVELQSADHWPMVLDFGNNMDRLGEKFGGASDNFNGQSVFVRRKTTYGAATGLESSVFTTTFAGLSEAQDVLPSATASPTALLLPAAPADTGRNVSIWDSIFDLASLRGLDVRERSLIMSLTPPAPCPSTRTASLASIYAAPWLRTSSVDSKLFLQETIQSVIDSCGGNEGEGRRGGEVLADRLWQLRLLFSWLDRSQRLGEEQSERGRVGDADIDTSVDQERERKSLRGSEISTYRAAGAIGQQMNGLWLRKTFVEEARWKVWGVQVGDFGGADGDQCSLH